MKAALNRVPSLSVRDGWWLEGHYEGVIGWAIARTQIQTAKTRRLPPSTTNSKTKSCQCFTNSPMPMEQ